MIRVDRVRLDGLIQQWEDESAFLWDMTRPPRSPGDWAQHQRALDLHRCAEQLRAVLLVLGDGCLEKIAERIARQAHEGQTEESTGDDYIHHVERVVAMVEGDAKTVAWLHDVIEDSDVTYGELGRAGIPSRIVDAVRLLTHGGEQETRTYAEYIEDIRRVNDPLALAVKIADLHDHLRPNCPERLRPRYEKALVVLGDGRVHDMGEPTEYGDRICERCNQQVPRRHRCAENVVLGDGRGEQEQ